MPSFKETDASDYTWELSRFFFNGEDQVRSTLKIDNAFNINRREGKQSECPDCSTSFAFLLEFFADEVGPPGYWKVFQA